MHQSEFICPEDPCPGDCDPEFQCERIPSTAAVRVAAAAAAEEEAVTALVTTTAAAAIEPGIYTCTVNTNIQLYRALVT